MESEKGTRLSISKMIVGLIVILLVTTGSLWVRGGGLLNGASVLDLDEAHVHGAVSSVGAQVDGRVSELHVELGQRVEAGDLLVTLENDALQARVDGAERVLKQRRLELERAQVNDRIATEQGRADLAQALSEVEAAEARLNAAQAQEDLRQREFERMEKLAGNQVVPQADLDSAREAVDAARALAERRQAEFDVNRALVDSARTELERKALRITDIDILRAEVAEAQADLARLKARIEYTRIRALETGVVVALPARLGASVASGDPQVEIWRTEKIWIRAWVSEDDLSKIAQGDRAKVLIDALDDMALDGTVHRILVARDGQESTNSGEPASPLLPDDARFAVQLLLSADNRASRRLLPGMSADVRILPSG